MRVTKTVLLFVCLRGQLTKVRPVMNAHSGLLAVAATSSDRIPFELRCQIRVIVHSVGEIFHAFRTEVGEVVGRLEVVEDLPGWILGWVCVGLS